MRKQRSHQDPTSSVARRLAVWGLLGVCLAASLWLAIRSEQKWSTARHVREPFQTTIGQPAKEVSSEDGAIGQESPRDAKQPPEASNTGQSPPTPSSRGEISGGQSIGHHRLGPEQADVQIVMFFDYASQRCQRVEQDVRALMKRFPDGVSLSLRHYPQSTDCNHMLKVNTHPNACQAARAAETAGILKGEAGFWQMHSWLSRRRGRFSLGELRRALPALGYNDDVDHFLEVMDGADPLEHVLRDVLDAATLRNVGPGTVVMNAIQLEGDEIEDALAQAARFLEGQPLTDGGAASQVTTSAGPLFSDELLAAALGATVQVINVSNGDQGSGVMVGKSGSAIYVLTADHLLGSSRPPADVRISADEGDRLEIRALSTTGNAAVVYRSVQVVARATDDDLAVLRFSTRRDVRAPLRICPPQLIPDEETFAALSVGWSRGAPTIAAGNVNSTKRVRKRSKAAATLVWELNRPSKPGQSGGPLVDREGYVVGVASGNSGGHGYFCHTEVIHRLLDENGLKWLYSKKTETAEAVSVGQ